MIEIKRIERAHRRHGDHFLKKIYTPNEIIYCKSHTNMAPHLAGRFAAKEAVVKALGTGFRGITWKDIEILNNEQGRPVIVLSPEVSKNLGYPSIMISISHTREHAIASAVWHKE